MVEYQASVDSKIVFKTKTNIRSKARAPIKFKKINGSFARLAVTMAPNPTKIQTQGLIDVKYSSNSGRGGIYHQDTPKVTYMMPIVNMPRRRVGVHGAFLT